MNAKVDQYIQKSKSRTAEISFLRSILLDCQLEEDLKWGKPCYSFDGKNVAIIQDFKSYFALLFFNGYLLKDPQNLLVKMGENTNVGRQLRFDDLKHIQDLENIVRQYIEEAKKLNNSTKQPIKKPNRVEMAIEFKTQLDNDPNLASAFSLLTPGRQKAYLFYFAQAKQGKTREARVQKCLAKIMAGKGLGD